MTKAHLSNGVGAPGKELERLVSELTAIRAELTSAPAEQQASLAAVSAGYKESARNFLQYLVLRRHDLRPLQLRLAALGLSSLGRAESHVLATIDAVLAVLHRLLQRDFEPSPETDAVDFQSGQRLLAEHTDALLGPAPRGRKVRIMVTMPSEAAKDYALIRDLLQQGMDCMRINCAHDDAAAWSSMVMYLRRAERELGRTCRIVMDLAGPKLRTGPLQPGPQVVRIRPSRDVYGKVTAPARVFLTDAAAPQAPPSPASASLLLPAPWLQRLRVGDKVRFTDARNAKRKLRITQVSDGGCWAESPRTAYLVPGTVLRQAPGDGKGADSEAVLGPLPPLSGALSLRQGDHLILTRDCQPGCPATYDEQGQLQTPAMIGCTIPEIFDAVRPGESIWFDDGKIGGVIEKAENARLLVRITQAAPDGEKLRSDKGINLPDSNLGLSALTAKDLEDLSFVAEHADVVELSFANTAEDVERLQQHLSHRRNPPPAIVLKIETRRGFDNLPEMLLTAMRGPCCGVMIARGDLAVESGFERLAEVQEEILWLCEAAHVPVIWATQVLETLAKTGMPSRAEITDAAMGHRAECVMLNKGPHVMSAVRVLDDILQRMQAHQAKKVAMLRELRLAHALSRES